MNDNGRSLYCGLVESVVDGRSRWAVVEYDKLGPILRMGPFTCYSLANRKLGDFAAWQHFRTLLAMGGP
jgi:hypothetical protein